MGLLASLNTEQFIDWRTDKWPGVSEKLRQHKHFVQDPDLSTMTRYELMRAWEEWVREMHKQEALERAAERDALRSAHRKHLSDFKVKQPFLIL